MFNYHCNDISKALVTQLYHGSGIQVRMIAMKNFILKMSLFQLNEFLQIPIED